jgi:hypothetical protein
MLMKEASVFYPIVCRAIRVCRPLGGSDAWVSLDKKLRAAHHFRRVRLPCTRPKGKPIPGLPPSVCSACRSRKLHPEDSKAPGILREAAATSGFDSLILNRTSSIMHNADNSGGLGGGGEGEGKCSVLSFSLRLSEASGCVT